MLRRVTLVVVVLVSLPALGTAATPVASSTAGSPVGGAGASTATQTPASPVTEAGVTASRGSNDVDSASTIQRNVELQLTPEEPGQYDAVVSFEIPDSVTSLTVLIGEESTVTSTTGFDQTSATELEWTESTQTPSFELTVAANETATGRRDVTGGPEQLEELAPARSLSPTGDGDGTNSAVDPIEPRASPVRPGHAATADEGLVFVDPGPWALVRTPRLGSRWRWTGSDVDLEESMTVAGDGATGGEIAYFGPVTHYDAMGENERVELVVPDRASLQESPSAILDTLTAASERLRVGARSDDVFLIAAPTDVDWGVSGIQYGDDDSWVVADAPLDTPNNIWLHEYVHTRQGYTTTESGTWATEATAEYYAALLALEQEHIAYDEFESTLAAGQRSQFDDDILAFPATWSSGSNYRKGALATGAIDLRLRQETNKTATFQTVFRDLNAYDTAISNQVILDAIQRAAGDETESYASTLTESQTTAETWTESTHIDAFGALPAVFEHRLGADSLTASGVFETRTLDGEELTLVTGETLNADVTTTNVGWETGEYETTMMVDDTVVATETGELDADQSETVPFTHTFDDPGTYTVTIGERTFTVTVREPTEPTVETIDAPATVDAGEEFTFTVTYRNTESVPGSVTVPFHVDDEELEEITVTVPAESSLDRRYKLTLPEAGNHSIRIGDRTTSVTVAGDVDGTSSDATGPETDSLPVPGFGGVTALLALLATIGLGASIAHRRRTG